MVALVALLLLLVDDNLSRSSTCHWELWELGKLGLSCKSVLYSLMSILAAGSINFWHSEKVPLSSLWGKELRVWIRLTCAGALMWPLTSCVTLPFPQILLSLLGFDLGLARLLRRFKWKPSIQDWAQSRPLIVLVCFLYSLWACRNREEVRAVIV